MKEVDDTAMAFRLLRLHGYSVSPGNIKRQTDHIRARPPEPFHFISHILHL